MTLKSIHRFLRSSATYVNRYNWIVLLLILIVHIFLKDRFFISYVLFYATPLPVIVCFSSFCAYSHRKSKKTLIALSILTLALGFFWISSSYSFNKPVEQSGKNIKILFWNTARIKKHPSDTLVKLLNQSSADFIGLVEAGNLTEESISEYRKRLTGYTIKNLPGGMLCMVKGNVQTTTYGKFPNRTRYNLLEVEINKNAYHIMIVDIGSNPFFSKADSFKEIITALPDKEHTIIMGDFNTPYNSVFFQFFKDNYYHAFKEAGTGFAATWCFGIPILQIDHIWVSRDLKPTVLKKNYHLISDHAKLLLKIDVSNN